MAQKKYLPKSLVIWDVDNTLTDSAKFWGVATGSAVDKLIKTFDLDRDDVRDAILRAPAQYRFSDFGSLIHWLDDQDILPKGKTPAEDHDIKMTQWAIRQAWYHRQKELIHFYPNTTATLRAIRAHGTAMAIYTDTEASSLIRRMWFLGRNAAQDGSLSSEFEIFKLFDHFYSQPSIEDDAAILREIDPDFILALKNRLTIFRPDPVTGLNRAKPSGDNMGQILADYNTEPKFALMMGDSDKDGGSARLGGVDFAWLKFGATLDRLTIKTAQTMASPSFKYGLKAIRTAMKDQNITPTVTLQRDVSEVMRKFDFIAGRGFNPCNEQSGPHCPHTGVCPADQMADATIHRLRSVFHSQERQVPTGPATHFPPAPPVSEQSNLCDKVGQQKRGLPPAHSPV